ncbi:MAG: cytochrome c peroxidase [Gemmatimonadota bacterium]
MTAYRRRFALLCCTVLLACSRDASVSSPLTSPAPELLNANGPVGFITGSPVAYDATKGGTVFSDPALKGLSYRIAFEGPSLGLSSTAGSITGTGTGPGVVMATLTATDGEGRIVSDRFAVVVFASGLPVPMLPALSLQYADAEVPLPAHYAASINGLSAAATDNLPPSNPITDAGATLGRVLFYDPRLSANDGTSCAGCHVQALGFTDALPSSVGFAGALTGRLTPGLTNARFYKRGRFFWDERAASLEAQVLGPIQNTGEMGMTLENLVAKVSTTPYYKPLFTSAFGNTSVTSDRIALALAQYVRSLVSTNSRYDRAFVGGVANFAASFTAEEIAGEALFRSAGCASCHNTISQVSDSVHNIGLDVVVTDTGAGRGAFKSPSLRNVAVRPFYMHDGRFSSLEQVVEFFNSGVQANPLLDARLRNTDGSPKRLNLTATQRAALVAYMKTLTDSTFLTSPRFSNPFAVTSVIPPVTSTNFSVTIQNKAYHPPTITVPPGSTVTFTNLDNQRHSATFASAAVTGTPTFTSGNRAVSMPATPGTYNYQCAVHGAQMTGVVIVK